MARESALSKWLESTIEGENKFKSQWAIGGETREKLWKEVGYANEGACYNQARNCGLIAGGQVSTGNKGEVDKTPRAKRVKGCLPVEVEKWAVLSAQADFIRDGNDEDDFIIPEVTPEFFFNLRAVRNQTKAFEKILTRIGGLDGDAGKALRAWAGQALTREQEEMETAEMETAAAATIMHKITKLLSKAREIAEKSGLEIGDEIAAMMAIHGLVETD